MTTKFYTKPCPCNISAIEENHGVYIPYNDMHFILDAFDIGSSPKNISDIIKDKGIELYVAKKHDYRGPGFITKLGNYQIRTDVELIVLDQHFAWDLNLCFGLNAIQLIATMKEDD